ncbi:MAG: HAD-IA family hydrolase [Paracoccaceae bacterium]
MRTVIFDLDGTLADTSGDLVAAGNAAFREMGLGDLLDPVADARTAMMGGGRAMLKAGFEKVGRDFGEADIEAGYPLLLAAYAQDIDRYSTLYPGTARAIEGLRVAGYGVGICTNKPEGLAHQLLTALGVRELFGSLVGADTLSVRKPDPAPMREAVARLGGDLSRSILVGDSPTDRETARAAGVRSLLVTFGPVGREVEALEPDALLDHYDDLGAAVAGLIG